MFYASTSQFTLREVRAGTEAAAMEVFLAGLLSGLCFSVFITSSRTTCLQAEPPTASLAHMQQSLIKKMLSQTFPLAKLMEAFPQLRFSLLR